nr:hypothetical protein [Tanacetum cinerariifolium]
MNLGTSSQPQPQQQRLVDTPPNSPPHSPTQASQSELSPARKGKSKGKGRNPHPRLGIIQSHKTFWGIVSSGYNHYATVQCTNDMITGKWTTLTRACSKFTAIVEKNARLSGENDSTWQAHSYKAYVQIRGSPFVHYNAWDFLKDHHKWGSVKAVRLERCVRTAEYLEELNELFRDDTIPRPPGKPMPSKSQRSDSSRPTRSSSTGKGPEAFKEMVQEELRIKRKKIWILSKRKKIRGN